MKKWKVLLCHRIWGLSFGIFFGTIFIDKPQWLSIIIVIPCLYFLIFGDTHFKEMK